MFAPFSAEHPALRSSVRVCIAALAFLVLAAAPSPAQVGGFGQNKIQYRRFDWHVLAGEHVDVFFYPEEERIARMALVYAEQSYATLARRLGHEVPQRIPLIIYASHVDFEQTNILPFVPPEGILGVTEFLKRRVALPFRGSYSEFRHTLRHELVHVFELSILAREVALHPRARLPVIPLWWSEGLAEFFSAEQDSRDDMVVRDLALGGRLPTLIELGPVVSPVVYALGGDAHRFLASQFGAWRVGLVYESLWKSTSFTDALERAYGRNADRLSGEWHQDLRRRHYPSVGDRKPISLEATRLASMALKPVALGDTSTRVAYLSPRSGYTNIYVQPLDPASRAEVVVEGERSPEFESLHPFSSRIDVRDGVLLFASRFGDRDALVFWDIARERVTGRYRFDGLVSLLSPQWSPDGRRVAFSALSDSGVSDLYTLELASGTLTRVTSDAYEDLDPTWLPHGRALIFSSDRAEYGATGARNLYRVELTGQVSALTTGPWSDESPRWDPRTARILFASDRAGAFDLYSIDTLGLGRRETSLTGGLFDPAPLPNDERVLVSAYADRAWSLYVVRKDPPDDSSFVLQRAQVAQWRWRELEDSSAAQVASRRYERRYSIDFAAGVAATAPGVGGAQGAQLIFSDLLGDHQFALSISSFQGTEASNVLGSLNGNIFYLNQARRVNWGMGVFRIAGTFAESDLRQLYEEQSTGMYGIARYPLSRFTRIEGQTTLEYSSRDDFANELVRGTPRRRGMLTGNYLMLVGDNALWLETGPIDGTRWNVTAGVVSDVTHGAFENWLGQVDVRRYLRTSQQAAIALRAFGYVSEGSRPRAIPLAGSWMLRGYPRYSLTGTHAWLANAEWRFPIANFVTVGFPFGAVRFPPVRGALFLDAGQAWNRGEYDKSVLGSGGIGFRMSLVPGFVLRLDVGRRFSLASSAGTPADRAYLERRFVDLFFGYDY